MLNTPPSGLGSWLAPLARFFWYSLSAQVSTKRSTRRSSLLLLLVSPLMAMCGSAPWEHGPIEEIFLGQKLPNSIMLDTPSGPMHVVSNGQTDPHAPQLIFIHGSPGGWDGWVDYLADKRLQSQAKLIAIDRPGFGSSNPKVMPRLVDQAVAISELLANDKNAKKAGPIILIGHSLGGPIALQLAAMQPDRIAGVLLLAASLDPALEKPRWYNKFANSWLFRWAVPEPMLRSNEEMMVLSEELEAQAELWPIFLKPKAPVITLMQGETDKLVYPENADYAEARLPSSQLKVIRLEKAGHFFIWEQRQRVIDEILTLLKRVSEPGE